MPMEFKDYFDALGALAGNAYTDAENFVRSKMNQADPNKETAAKLVVAFSKYTKDTVTAAETEKKKVDVLSFDEWAKTEAQKAVPGASAEAITSAKTYLESDAKVKAAQTELFAQGKVALDKTTSFLGGIWEWIKKNKFGLGAAALGGVLGNALDLGMIGTLAIAAGTMFVGSAFIDDDGMFSGLFKSKPTMQPSPQPYQPGKVIPVMGPANEVFKPGQKLPEPKLEAITDDKLKATLPDGKTKATHMVNIETEEAGGIKVMRQFVGTYNQANHEFTGYLVNPGVKGADGEYTPAGNLVLPEPVVLKASDDGSKIVLTEEKYRELLDKSFKARKVALEPKPATPGLGGWLGMFSPGQMFNKLVGTSDMKITGQDVDQGLIILHADHEIGIGAAHTKTHFDIFGQIKDDGKLTLQTNTNPIMVGSTENSYKEDLVIDLNTIPDIDLQALKEGNEAQVKLLRAALENNDAYKTMIRQVALSAGISIAPVLSPAGETSKGGFKQANVLSEQRLDTLVSETDKPEFTDAMSKLKSGEYVILTPDTALTPDESRKGTTADTIVFAKKDKTTGALSDFQLVRKEGDTMKYYRIEGVTGATVKDTSALAAAIADPKNLKEVPADKLNENFLADNLAAPLQQLAMKLKDQTLGK